jgi:D-3-phosphoglycerate dehydrogenase
LKPFILVCDGFDKVLFENLKSIKELEVHPKAKNSKEDIEALLPKASALIIRSATTVDVALLEKAPNLKLVIRAGEGTDNIDKKACALKGVKVANTPGANNNSAAEHAIALMMSALRKIPAAHTSMKAGLWDKASFEGNELWRKKVGIVGFGRIGQIVAKRLAGFEVEVLFFDPFIKYSDIPYAKAASSLEEVFEKSDLVTIHVPLMEQTKNMITKTQLELMKPHAFLIDAARGKIVNEKDLYDILSAKKIRGAAFDVFASEPLEKDTPLLKLDNLLLTPHIGASTEEAQVRVGEMCVDQVKEFFVNHKLLNEVKA